MEPEDPERHIKEDTPDVIEDTPPGSDNAGEPAEPAEPVVDTIDPVTPPFCGDSESESDDYDYFDEEVADRSVHGWLAFFLWVKLALGFVITAISVLYEFEDMSLFSEFKGWTIFYLATLFLLVLYIIIGFYRHWADAVYAAFALLGVSLIDNIGTGVVASSIKFMPVEHHVWITGAIWSVIWICFLFKSRRVEAVVPPETRRMRWPSYLLSSVALVAVIGYLTSFSEAMSRTNKAYHEVQLDNTADIVDDPYNYIIDETGDISAEPTVEDYNAIIDDNIKHIILPQVLNDEVSFDNISNRENEVVYNYKYFYPKSSLSLSVIKKNCADFKKSLAADAQQIERATALAGKNLTLKFVDVNGALGYKYTIKSSELKKILEIE